MVVTRGKRNVEAMKAEIDNNEEVALMTPIKKKRKKKSHEPAQPIVFPLLFLLFSCFFRGTSYIYVIGNVLVFRPFSRGYIYVAKVVNIFTRTATVEVAYVNGCPYHPPDEHAVKESHLEGCDWRRWDYVIHEDDVIDVVTYSDKFDSCFCCICKKAQREENMFQHVTGCITTELNILGAPTSDVISLTTRNLRGALVDIFASGQSGWENVHVYTTLNAAFDILPDLILQGDGLSAKCEINDVDSLIKVLGEDWDCGKFSKYKQSKAIDWTKKATVKLILAVPKHDYTARSSILVSGCFDNGPKLIFRAFIETIG